MEERPVTRPRVLSEPRSRPSPIFGVALCLAASVIVWTVAFLVYEWVR